MEFPFDIIDSLQNVKDKIFCLNTMTTPIITTEDQHILGKLDMLEVANQVNAILTHPCPQNRTSGSPYIGQEPGMAAWFIGDFPPAQDRIRKEHLGLLSLTARNDDITEVTAIATKKYIKTLIKEQLLSIKSNMFTLYKIQFDNHVNPNFNAISEDSNSFYVGGKIGSAMPVSLYCLSSKQMIATFSGYTKHGYQTIYTSIPPEQCIELLSMHAILSKNVLTHYSAQEWFHDIWVITLSIFH